MHSFYATAGAATPANARPSSMEVDGNAAAAASSSSSSSAAQHPHTPTAQSAGLLPIPMNLPPSSATSLVLLPHPSTQPYTAILARSFGSLPPSPNGRNTTPSPPQQSRSQTLHTGTRTHLSASTSVFSSSEEHLSHRYASGGSPHVIRRYSSNPIRVCAEDAMSIQQHPPPPLPPTMTQMQQSNPPQFSFRMTKYFFHRATETDECRFFDGGVPYLDTTRQMFGLRAVQLILDENIANPLRAPSLYTGALMSARHFTYFFAPHGYGFRTLLVNYCREHQLNLFVITGLLGNTYVGSFTQLIAEVSNSKPCVVLFDHLDQYLLSTSFDHLFSRLFVDYANLGIDNVRPIAPLWFVFTGTEPWERLHPNFQEWTRTSWAMVEALERDQVERLLIQLYGQMLVEVGFTDDRPLPPKPTDTQERLNAIMAQLRDSKLEAILRAQMPILRDVAERITDGANASKRHVTPPLLVAVIRKVFQQAAVRTYEAAAAAAMRSCSSSGGGGGGISAAPRVVSITQINIENLPTLQNFLDTIKMCVPFTCNVAMH